MVTRALSIASMVSARPGPVPSVADLFHTVRAAPTARSPRSSRAACARYVTRLQAGGQLSPALAELHGKVTTGDPYIEKLRVGRNRPGYQQEW